MGHMEISRANEENNPNLMQKNSFSKNEVQ